MTGKNSFNMTNDEKTEFEVVRNVLIIHVNGELDHHNSIFIREGADEIVCNNSIKNIVFDFGGTNFMDSSGIGVIMGRYKKVKSCGGTVGVINVKKNVEKILLYSGMNKIIQYFSDIDDVVDKLGGRI